jgi:hypothetical protein
MHGHDVGIWVCEGSGISLSPCLFMQAVCPNPVPRPLFVKWKLASALPKSFRNSGALPLIYSECGRLPPWPYYLHLFAPQAPVTRAFEQESELHDWSLAVPVIGIIAIFDRKHDGLPSALSLRQLFDRSLKPTTNRTLAWVRDQHVPFVVAALGYDDAPDSAQQLRGRYDIAADIVIVPGPAMADAKRRSEQEQGEQTSGMFSGMFEHQKLALDQEHARAVLDELFQLIERER